MNVRFTPKSGHLRCRVSMSATCQQRTLASFNNVVGHGRAAVQLKLARLCGALIGQQHAAGTDHHPQDRKGVQPLSEQDESGISRSRPELDKTDWQNRSPPSGE